MKSTNGQNYYAAPKRCTISEPKITVRLCRPLGYFYSAEISPVVLISACAGMTRLAHFSSEELNVSMSFPSRGRYDMFTQFQKSAEVTVANNYWSSSTYVGNTTNAWNVNFNDGNVNNNNKTNALYVRCVSGAWL